ncbi:MAG: GspE/PulE family protein [Bacteroidota bacterium]
MNEIKINIELQQLITSEQAWHYSIIPKEENSGNIVFFTTKENAIVIEDEMELIFGSSVQYSFVCNESIKHALSRYYHSNNGSGKQIQQLNNKDVDGFLGRIINEAHQARSSDIHIEPMKEKCRIRIRIDGKLIEKYKLNLKEYPGLLNKIKVKSNLDIAEKRLPQDGRMAHHTNNSKFDIRVSTLPSIYGEKIVMRLLSNDTTEININSLGFNENQLSDYLAGIKRNQGIILISGPTGSGKTTTLYATLKILNKEDTNILTIEDPVEYTIDGINQVALKEGIGLTFAKALRTFLRQDPDIIMLGEIRDVDTAQMAIRAALTGHLVLSTVHTNSAWGTISRLIDMGVPAYNLADTLVLSVAQRLIRLLCPHCKSEDANVEERVSSNLWSRLHKQTVYKAVGCNQCHYTGFKGRKALYEVLPVDKALGKLIKQQTSDIDNYLKTMGIITIPKLALNAVISGDTSIDEAIPLILADDSII